jgi:hypothetical protein
MRKPSALVALAFALTACSSPTASVSPTPGLATPATGEATLEPSAEASPSAAASVEPTTQPIGEFQVLPPGAAVEVAVKELNLRRLPTTSAKRVDTLKRGEVLITSPVDQIDFGYGPVNANGYTWYPVVKLQVPGPDGQLPPLPTAPIQIGAELVGGWVAADDGKRPFITALPPRCPTTVDLENLEGMLPAERLACFGEPILLEGTFGCGGCGGVNPSSFKPKWLIDPFYGSFLSSDPSERIGPTWLHFPPDGPPQPADGSIIRVTVHVDDPRSTKCSIALADSSGAPTIEIDARTSVLLCREQLVVESYDITGTDPSFPG